MRPYPPVAAPSTNGMAVASLVLGWIGVGFLVLFIVVAVLGMASGPDDSDALRLLPS